MLSLHVEAISEALQLAAQMRVIDRANDGVAAPQLVGVQGLPFAPRHACEIGDYGMDMTLGIESAARVVLEEGIDEISGLDRTRSEDRRVGKECVSTVRSRWSRGH